MAGKLIVISGPSGVGKTTICDALLKYPGFQRVITATSRPPRKGERDGVDYHFLTERAFLESRERGEFLESARVHGHLYGTPRREVEAGLREGKWVLLNIDVQGARQIREGSGRGSGLPLTTVFLEPPSMEELCRRIGTRGTDDPETARRRLETAREEMKERHNYEHVILNDDLGSTVQRIIKAIGYKEIKNSVK